LLHFIFQSISLDQLELALLLVVEVEVVEAIRHLVHRLVMVMAACRLTLHPVLAVVA
jgi:hypothetical protein